MKMWKILTIFVQTWLSRTRLLPNETIIRVVSESINWWIQEHLVVKLIFYQEKSECFLVTWYEGDETSFKNSSEA